MKRKLTQPFRAAWRWLRCLVLRGDRLITYRIDCAVADSLADTTQTESGRPPNQAGCDDAVNAKARRVAEVASDIVWGGSHGWEDDEVGEYDLAHALRNYVRHIRRQNGGDKP